MFNPWDWINASPYRWGEVGLVFDITGGFFVSVEAIGLHNIQSLQNKLFVPGRNLIFKVMAFFDFTAYEKILKNNDTSERKRLFKEVFLESSPSFRKSLKSILVLLYLMISCFALFQITNHRMFGLGQLPFPLFPFIMDFYILTIILFLFLLFQFLIYATKFIEDNTQKGIVGILGFFLLFIGFALQFYSNHLQSIQYLHTMN